MVQRQIGLEASLCFLPPSRAEVPESSGAGWEALCWRKVVSRWQLTEEAGRVGVVAVVTVPAQGTTFLRRDKVQRGWPGQQETSGHVSWPCLVLAALASTGLRSCPDQTPVPLCPQGTGLIPGCRTKILHAILCGQKNKRRPTLEVGRLSEGWEVSQQSQIVGG